MKGKRSVNVGMKRGREEMKKGAGKENKGGTDEKQRAEYVLVIADGRALHT